MKILPSSPDFWLTLQNGKCWQCWTHTAVWQPVTSADQRPRPFCGTWALLHHCLAHPVLQLACEWPFLVIFIYLSCSFQAEAHRCTPVF